MPPLLNLVAGVDALRAAGVEIHRILVIGGAAISPAVQQIAPLLFGVPVAIPAAGEYVGIGAARQAAWALSGTAKPPAWSTSIDAQFAPGPADQAADIVQRYRQAVHALHGR